MLKVFSTLVFLFVSSLAFSQDNKVQLCGTPDSQIIDSKVLERMQNAGKNPNVRMADLPMLECLVAVAVENDIYQFYNKNHDVIKEMVYNYFDKVSKIYETEMKIKLTVAHVEIIDTPREDTLQKTVSKLGYHIAHLFRLGDAVPGWAAGIAFVGKSSDGSYDLYCISGNFNYERIILKTMAHEIGHCFDSPHTHNCNWPNGPIDICFYVECDNNNYGDATYSEVGSIMSYCQSSILTFNPYCREFIRSRANEILKPIKSIPDKPTIDTTELSYVETEPFLGWKFINNSINYRLQISDNPSFTKPIIDSTINYNFFHAYGLINDKKYFWRVKAINHIGSSEWSETVKFTCKTSTNLFVPVVKGAFLDVENISNVRLEVYPVNGATGYEFRITDLFNYVKFKFSTTYNNQNPTFSVKSPIFNYYQLAKDSNTEFFWQARAIRNGSVGEWSSLQKIIRYESINHIYPLQSTNLSTTIPIIWTLGNNPYGSYNNNREYTLQVAEDKNFTKIYYQKTRLLNTIATPLAITNLGLEIVENLKPNTEYFFRYKESARPNFWQISSFKTGAKNSKWKFINSKNQLFLGEIEESIQSSDSSKIIFKNRTDVYETDGVNWNILSNSLSTKGFVDTYKVKRAIIHEDSYYYIENNNEIIKYDGKVKIKLSESFPINIKDRNFTSINFDKKGNIFVSVQEINNSSYSSVKIYKYISDKWFALPELKELSPTRLLFDNNNNLTVHVENKGTYRIIENNWELIHPNTQQNTTGIFAFDKKNNLWWTTYYGVFKVDENKKIYSFLAGRELPSGDYKDLIIDKKDVLWIKVIIDSEMFLLKFKDEKWANIENGTPLPIRIVDGFSRFDDYRGSAIDQQNRLWIFTSKYGIFIYDDSGQVKSQSITAENITNKKTSDKPFRLIANASSGLSPTYKIISGPAIIKKDSIFLTGKGGKVTIQISQSGNEIYEAAKNVELNFEVIAKLTQTITFNKIEQKTLTDNPFSLIATASSGLPITYQIVSGPATINGNIITLTGTGKVIIKAKQDGNADFLAANDVSQEFCVIPAKPIITSDFSNAWQLKVNTDKNIQWYYEGKKIVNGTQPSLLATENGKYYVEITNSDATCASNISDVFQLLILATENEQNQTIKIFPNPADDWVTIDSELPQKISGIKLYDLKGSLLYSNDKVEFPHKIKVQHSWKGNAFLEIKTKGKTYIKKLILL